MPSTNTRNSHTSRHSGLSDYYPFGMQMQGREFAGGIGYRWGFGGKENIIEYEYVDYGFRVCSPKLCRFLTVDPLSHAYPWNSRYAYAENTPIQSIDLDGLEELQVNVIHKANSFVQQAVVSISQVFWVVNEGKGAVHNFPYKDFQDIMQTGNRKGPEKMYATTLPSARGEMLLLAPRYSKLAQRAETGDGMSQRKLERKGIDKVFSVEIQFNIYALPGGKIEDAMQWNQWLPNLNGLIMGQVVGKERNTIRPSELRNFLGDVNRALHKETDVGGYATNSQIYSHPYNFVSVRNQSGFSLTLSQVAAHEVGHTLSVWHIHCKDQSEATQGCNGRDFEYSSEGLGSNTYPYVSNKNLLNIINDKGNRGTIK